MGTLEKPTAKIKFDGTPKSWPMFKEAMLKWADGENFAYMLEGGHGLCAIFQAASAAAAKKANGDGTKGTISLDIAKHKEKDIEAEFKKASVTTSVSLALRKNRKDQLGANWADHDKCGMTQDELDDAHEVLDTKYLRHVNRALTRALHDAVFPGAVETIATTKLRSILKTPAVVKILAGDALGGEDTWADKPWLMPAMQMWGKLSYRFEGMTDMINGTFMEDLGDMLNAVTGPQRKTLYQADQEFEKMCETLLNNFGTIKSLMHFLRSSLRQTMIRKLSKVGKEKDAWKKADEYLTQLQDDDHMLTLEDTDAAIKRAEQYLHRNEDAGADNKDKKVVFKADVEDAESAQSKEFDALKAQVQALQAQLRGDTPGAKRGRNGVPVKKEIPVCAKCKKRGHKEEDCWDGLDDAKAKLDAALAKREKQKEDIARRKPSAKEARAYAAACNKASAAAEESDYFWSRVSLHGARFDPPKSTHVALQAVLDQEFVHNILCDKIIVIRTWLPISLGSLKTCSQCRRVLQAV